MSLAIKILKIILAVIVLLWLIHQLGFAQTASCPAGSYAIGQDDSGVICKAQPTGCPYGDSIPLDSPKCQPPQHIDIPQDVAPVSPPSPADQAYSFKGK